jgi:hypothetical protein
MANRRTAIALSSATMPPTPLRSRPGKSLKSFGVLGMSLAAAFHQRALTEFLTDLEGCWPAMLRAIIQSG